MLLKNVLPVPAGRTAHTTAPGPSSLDFTSAKNRTLQQDQLISPQKLSSDNFQTTDAETQPKTKPAANTDFKKVLNRQIKSQKPAIETVSQQTDIKTPQQVSPPSPDSSQPTAALVSTNDASTTPLIPDTAVAGNITPAPNTPTQSADTPLAQIADIFINNGQSMPAQNQPQFPQPDASQQIQPTASNQPVQNTSQLITSPDKPDVTQQLKVENPVSPHPSVIRNPSSDNSIPDTNMDSKPVDFAGHNTTAEGQETLIARPPSPHSARLAVAGWRSTIDQPVNPNAESPAPQAIHIAKTNTSPEPISAKTQEQPLLNQQSATFGEQPLASGVEPSRTSGNFTRRPVLHSDSVGGSESEGGQQSSASSKNHQSATCGEHSRTISNQQLIQPPVSQDKTAASPEKPDAPKADFQNVNTTPIIARDQTTPDSGANVTGASKLPTETLHNLSAANNDPAAALREQISQSVTAASQQLNRQITIRLNPPELGKLSVKFTQAGSGLTGLIEASNPRTRADINQQIPEILRSLEQAGVSVKRIDVTLSDLPGRSSPDTHRDNSSQFNWDRPAGSYHDSPRHHFSSDSYSTSVISSSYSLAAGTASAPVPPSAASSSALDVLI